MVESSGEIPRVEREQDGGKRKPTVLRFLRQ